MQFPVPACWPDQQFPPSKPESRFCCSYFPVVAAIPEAFEGGLLGIVENGDKITIDITKRTIDLEVPEDEIKRRQDSWIRPQARYTRGVLAKYAKSVSSASLGAVTDLE